MDLLKLYFILLKEYGPRGWWPLVSKIGEAGFDEKGYHLGIYDYPKTDLERFEICLGTIATQNTAWTNAEKAIRNLHEKGMINPNKLISARVEKIAELIRPSGYYNQKAIKMKAFAKFFVKLTKTPSREELLEMHGVGKETADSILLYAYNQTTFVVDAYTKRLIKALKFQEEDYDEVKYLFESNLPKKLDLYQEYHALIVKHCKKYYRGKNLIHDLLAN